MTTVFIKGRLTDDGRIEAELPDGWQPGDVTIEVPIEQETEWTDEELKEMLNFKGLTLGEIPADLIGAGADWDIGDSAEWVEEQRRKRMEERRKRWTD
jgi:hypothetical protein